MSDGILTYGEAAIASLLAFVIGLCMGLSAHVTVTSPSDPVGGEPQNQGPDQP